MYITFQCFLFNLELSSFFDLFILIILISLLF